MTKYGKCVMRGVLVPTYNEAENIKELIPRIRQYLPDAKIIIVDDDSEDSTAEIARKLDAIVFVRKGEKGLGSALRFGLLKGLELGFEYLATMDADLSHDPIYLPKMFEEATKADLIIGSRYIEGGKIENWPLKRRIISKGANMLAKTLLRIDVKDNTSGYRVYSRNAIEVVKDCKNADGYEFQICAVYKVKRAGLRIVEVPITFRDRSKGKSKLGSEKILNWFVYVLKLSLGFTS
ncbi:glycosyltransferase [Sulfurisphaera ohwakuensis]|uniref:Glycosyltransferase n=2 Tax=Sulfurisphaera ohwakuensis TaxID=69656 RepID=A0A650CJC6_SULOH|nr:glycosyltransferase [Sulfurisphaera ohwakuensis]